ncbi:MAG: HAMP domain-containing protein [Anaerolineae bacterium]|nr:HAMP domain-containing protein [Anaerolineae bacterium]
MLSFSLLLVVCLSILTVAFVLLFFVWVSLPDLAYARLTDAALPMLAHVRALRQQGERPAESVEALRSLAQESRIRFLVVTEPNGAVLADSEGEWVGQKIRPGPLRRETVNGWLSSRGRLVGPDGTRLFYVAFALQEDRADQSRRVHLVLAIAWIEVVRPFIGSLVWSVCLAGATAFALSILLAMWLARSLSRPLQRAAAAAEQVAAGDYTISLDMSVPEEARRLADSFNAMTRAVASAQRSQRDFVANVSHELRTPLTSIQGFAQAILDGTASDASSAHRASAVIHDEAERLSRMVGHLLDLTRLESGEDAMSWSQVDLHELLSACAGRFALLAEEKGIRLETDLGGPVRVIGDGDRLTQVFANLIENALKHTDPGGRVSLSIRDGQPDAPVSVLVTDTGCGIPAKDLPRVFERFYQVDKARSRSTDPDRRGVGLGLAIASEIARAHGGRIDAESIVGVGTRFTVALPRGPAASTPQQGADAGRGERPRES